MALQANYFCKGITLAQEKNSQAYKYVAHIGVTFDVVHPNRLPFLVP